MAKNYAAHNPQQLIKISGKNTFVEVMNTAFGIGKVIFNFAKYDDKREVGQRMTDNVTVYLDIDKALVLIQDIKSGRIPKLAQTEKAKSQYPKAVYTDLGGTSAKALAAKGKSREDGMSESRQLKLVPGKKADFMICAERGAGEENQTGLIVPRKVETNIMVPMSGEDLKRLALVLEMNIHAYTAARYVDGSFMKNPYQQAKEQEKAKETAIK